MAHPLDSSDLDLERDRQTEPPEAERTPRPPTYVELATFPVGPCIVTLAERAHFGRNPDGIPMASRRRVLMLAIARDIETPAEARALAAALETMAADLDSRPVTPIG